MSSGTRRLRSNSTATRAPPTKPLATSGRAPSTRPAPAPAAAAPPTSQTTSSPTKTMGESNPTFSHALHGAHHQTKPQKSPPPSPVPSTSGRSTSVASETTMNSLNSSTVSQPPEVLYKYTIQNIPQKFATQKQLYAVLITHLALKDVETLKVNFNKSALLITRSELPANFEARLRVACLDNKVTINIINRPKKSLAPAKKAPFFSIVIRDVDLDIEERDILEIAPHLKIHKMWRIVSKKTNKPTPLIRVISADVSTIDGLLTDGIVLFGRLHRCEPSNAPPPTPVQCSKCFTLGHQASECSQKPICPRCTETHAPNKCPKEVPECPFCKGPHPAWSRKCPEFLKLTVTDETQTLPTIIIDPPTEFADPVDLTDEAPEEVNLSQIHAKALIAFVTKTLFDILPLNIPKTQQAIQEASLAVFNLKTRINHSGRLIHFTFDA
ncbi:hypothetical protein Zmor_028379 [Zophobas morio]|uniref:Gag-like protein n=1 Tax=Zophobas morio TaxID=2755281 RepID=A0AA38HVD4_9CUCU|nr:hypothetical protein Zmor_028379 [Zophobas morio]